MKKLLGLAVVGLPLALGACGGSPSPIAGIGGSQLGVLVQEGCKVVLDEGILVQLAKTFVPGIDTVESFVKELCLALQVTGVKGTNNFRGVPLARWRLRAIN